MICPNLASNGVQMVVAMSVGGRLISVQRQEQGHTTHGIGMFLDSLTYFH